jgi:hypothetical protein
MIAVHERNDKEGIITKSKVYCGLANGTLALIEVILIKYTPLHNI